MQSAFVIPSAITLLKIALFSVLAFRLFQTGLFRRYRFFTAHTVFETVRMAVMGVVDIRTDLYAHLYFATQPIAWLLYAAVVQEVFQLALESRPGIATLSRKVVSGALAVSCAIAAATLLFGVHEGSPFRVIEYYLLFERVISTTLLLFVIALMAFLAHFPVPLSRNSRVHAAVFGFYFTAKTASLYVRAFLGPTVVDAVNTGLNAIGIVSVLAWILLLRSNGETVPARMAPQRSKQEEERLLEQLNAINRTLVRSARR